MFSELLFADFSNRGSRSGACLVFPFIFFCFVLSLIMQSSTLRAMPVFINELHYDNVGADIGEGVELAGLAGTNLQGWQLWFYNGGNGQSYGSLALSGVFVDSQSGYGVLEFSFAGIQNGSPDGIALIDAASQLQQFISYEGAFVALGGVAASRLSEEIGIAETSQTTIGTSLQLMGRGSDFEDFQWRASASSFGSINVLQHFEVQRVVQGTVASTSTWALLALGLLGFGLRGSVKQEVVVTV